MTLWKELKKKHNNIYTLLVVIGVVAVWRGLWGLMDFYLFPESPLLSFSSSIVIGLLLLWLNDFRLDELK